MENVSVNEVEIDIVQQMGDYIVVQEKITKAIYVILVSELDSPDPVSYNNDLDNNVISLEYRVRSWLLKKAQKLEREKRQKSHPNQNKPQKLRRQLKLQK